MPTQKAPPWAIAWGPHSRNPATTLVTRLSAVSFPWAQIKSATDTATTAASNLDKNYGAPRPPKRARPGPSRKRAPGAQCWLIAWAGIVPLHGPELPLLRPAVPSRVLVRGAGITSKIDEKLKLSAAVDKAASKVDELKSSVTSKVPLPPYPSPHTTPTHPHACIRQPLRPRPSALGHAARRSRTLALPPRRSTTSRRRPRIRLDPGSAEPLWHAL